MLFLQISIFSNFISDNRRPREPDPYKSRINEVTIKRRGKAVQRKYLEILSSKANISEARLSCSFLCTHCFRFRTVSPTLTLLAARGFLAPPPPSLCPSLADPRASDTASLITTLCNPYQRGKTPKAKLRHLLKNAPGFYLLRQR